MEFKKFLKKHNISTKNLAAIYGRISLTDFKTDRLIVANRIDNGLGIKVSIYRNSTREPLDSWQGTLTPYYRKMFNNYWQ
jgi:hypothetical protein